MKKKETFHLTNNEKFVMDIFWQKNTPLTSIDIIDNLPSECKEWKNGYLHNVLRKLISKKILKITHIIQINTRSARVYEPTLSKESYAAKLISNQLSSQDSLSKVAYALVKEATSQDKEKIISELQSILDELKQDSE